MCKYSAFCNKQVTEDWSHGSCPLEMKTSLWCHTENNKESYSLLSEVLQCQRNGPFPPLALAFQSWPWSECDHCHDLISWCLYLMVVLFLAKSHFYSDLDKIVFVLNSDPKLKHHRHQKLNNSTKIKKLKTSSIFSDQSWFCLKNNSQH